ncbi:MAG: hypothetical protein ACK56F_08080, partial [bacterium]
MLASPKIHACGCVRPSSACTFSGSISPLPTCVCAVVIADRTFTTCAVALDTFYSLSNTGSNNASIRMLALMCSLSLVMLMFIWCGAYFFASRDLQGREFVISTALHTKVRLLLL